MLILHQASFMESNFTFLAITFSIAVGIFILDYFIPLIGAKKFGGTKSGIIGATVGLIVGLLFLGPLGIFLGTFLGAFLGELIHDPKKQTYSTFSCNGLINWFSYWGFFEIFCHRYFWYLFL